MVAFPGLGLGLIGLKAKTDLAGLKFKTDMGLAKMAIKGKKKAFHLGGLVGAPNPMAEDDV